MVKCLPTIRETWVQSLGWKDLLENETASHSSILAWKIPWMEEPVRTRLSDFTFTFCTPIGKKKKKPNKNRVLVPFLESVWVLNWF